MPTALPQPRLLLVVAGVALCAGIIAVPVFEAFIVGRELTASIVGFSALTLVILLVGAVWLRRVGALGPRPATTLRPEPLVVIAALAVAWAMVIVESPHATYFLLAMFALAQWLLPVVLGVVVALLLAGFTVAGQIFHHGVSTGTIVGPLASAAVITTFMLVLRQLVDAQVRLAETEREAGRLAERSRMGRDLHDTVAQSLSSIQLHLHAAERSTDRDAARDHVVAARAAAAQSLAETRSFVSALTPPDLASSALTTAISRVAQRAQAQGVAVDVTVDGPSRRLATPVETTLLRIAQESLSNVIRHAEANRAEVRLLYTADAVEMEIDDDGVGFEVGHGFGITGMRARAEELGGYAAVVSAPGEGTLVSVHIPLTEADA